MKQLRKPTKYDILINIFDEVGKRMSVRDVCEISGIESYNNLKAGFSYIRTSKYVPDENRIDVRIQDDVCIRVN